MYRLKTTLTYAITIPLLTFLMGLVYHPTFGMGIEEISLWRAHFSFCHVIGFCIILVTMLLSRLLMVFISERKYHLTSANFLIWAVCEIQVVNFFLALFYALYFDEDYLDILPMVLLYGTLAMLPSYVIVDLFIHLRTKDERLQQNRDQIASLLRKPFRPEESDGMVKFVDEKGVMKLAVAKNRIIYIESAGNYVTIVYDNDGRQVRYALRNTLKGIEELCSANGLERCHRSYFLNLARVKLLRRDGDGLLAEIDFPGVEPIPVSKSYMGEVMHKVTTTVE